MKKNKIRSLLASAFVMLVVQLNAQIGYHDAPYTRYEANLGTLTSATITPKSYTQSDLQSEASDQICVNLPSAGSAVSWTVSSSGDGLVVRYSIPDGTTGVLEVYADNVLAGTLNLNTYYSWENLGFSNANPKMRFDEVRFKFSSPIAAGGNLKLVNQSGNIHLDFAELELIPAAVTASPGDAVYSGDGSNLQNFIDANGGETIYLPAGVYNVNRELYFGVDNTVLKGAGMWHTNIHFTHTGSNGGLRANADDISYSGLFLTTVRNSRSNSYKAINGVYTSGSTITDIWADHFECGAWIGQYNMGGPAYADGFTMSYCRFRNNYADGINLCKGTRNSIVEHCSFRNNGDDDMAIWSADGLECRDNIYRYNTSENCWRASGVAIYGGYSNKAMNILIKDNLEVGIRVNNSYAGVGFNSNGMHEFSDITIIACGTFNDLWNTPVGAIDLVADDVAGTRVQNVKFSNISIIDSKNDAIYIVDRGGEGFFNLIFDNITIDGTGKEYPNNNANGLAWGRGYGILFVGYPAGNATYCNMSYTDRGGNAGTNVNTTQIGTLSWTASCIPAHAPEMTSTSTFGICDDPITFTATAAAPASNTVSYVEFFVNNVSIGQDNSDPYSIEWSNSGAGEYQVKAVAHYTPSATPATSNVQNVMIADGIYTTTSVPVIDGTIDASWSEYASFALNKVAVGTVTNAADLSGYFKIRRDATNLYMLVEVTDDVLRTDGAQVWQRDGLELYIDMGNDKSGSYVANDDFQYRFIYGVNTVQTGLTFAQTTKAGNLGYIVEIQLPWSTLGGAPSNGEFMGLDLHIEDNDTGTRDGKKTWNDASDNAWNSTSVLGTLQIAGCSNPLTPVIDPMFNGKEISFYPNPFQETGSLNIDNAISDAYIIYIKDMSGRLIATEKLAGTGPYSVGENLVPGMYMLEVSDGVSTRSLKFIKY